MVLACQQPVSQRNSEKRPHWLTPVVMEVIVYIRGSVFAQLWLCIVQKEVAVRQRSRLGQALVAVALGHLALVLLVVVGLFGTGIITAVVCDSNLLFSTGDSPRCSVGDNAVRGAWIALVFAGASAITLLGMGASDRRVVIAPIIAQVGALIAAFAWSRDFGIEGTWFSWWWLTSIVLSIIVYLSLESESHRGQRATVLAGLVAFLVIAMIYLASPGAENWGILVLWFVWTILPGLVAFWQWDSARKANAQYLESRR
jgi:hypothetical protein